LLRIYQECKEASEWGDGAKSSKGKEEKEEKKHTEAARKAENAHLLAEEEADQFSEPLWFKQSESEFRPTRKNDIISYYITLPFPCLSWKISSRPRSPRGFSRK